MLTLDLLILCGGGLGELILTRCRCHVKCFKRFDAILMICLVITYLFFGL